MTRGAGYKHLVDISAQRADLLTCHTSLVWNLSGPLLLSLILVHFALGWGLGAGSSAIRSNCSVVFLRARNVQSQNLLCLQGLNSYYSPSAQPSQPWKAYVGHLVPPAESLLWLSPSPYSSSVFQASKKRYSKEATIPHLVDPPHLASDILELTPAWPQLTGKLPGCVLRVEKSQKCARQISRSDPALKPWSCQLFRSPTGGSKVA